MRGTVTPFPIIHVHEIMIHASPPQGTACDAAAVLVATRFLVEAVFFFSAFCNSSCVHMPGGFAQPLNVVEGALFGEEDVDDEVDVVEQDPLAETLAFDGVGIGAEVALQAHLNLIGDGRRSAARWCR